MKILCTGLGYISMELFDLLRYSNHDVTFIDNQFYPDRVAAVIRRGFKFYQRDLFNIRDLLKNKDVVIHTAGITDKVPQTQAQSNPEIDSLIHKIGTEGTREIINNISADCRFFLLSTHVCFEGISYSPEPLTEESQTAPLLAYSRSKRQSEIDLLESNINFNILRLGSVYGFNSAIRYKILPNLFSLKTSQNENLKVFGAGNNIKPIVGVHDVAAFILFLIGSNYNREIFHVVSEHKTVKEIAEICQKVNPNINIEHTDDVVENLGYELSNKKILATGFNFLDSIEFGIRSMVNAWKNR